MITGLLDKLVGMIPATTAVVWFHVLGVISAVALAVGVVTAFASVTLSWIIFRHQEDEQARITQTIALESRRLLEIKNATDAMWARMQPRILAVDAFLEVLKRHPIGTAIIQYQPEDQEAYAFAFSLWPALGHAGWIVAQPEPFRRRVEAPYDRMPAGFAAGAQLNRGVTLVANAIGPESKNEAYRTLNDAFLASKIDLGASRDESLADNVVKILVGQKL
jgi:hypothetical protein